MTNVTIGKGNLDDKGVFAGRDFKAGELVVPYNWQQISAEEFTWLETAEQKLFVHSFWGKRYLFPEPARYVNHSATPNTSQDLYQQADIASKDIKKGQAITTDANLELKNEIDTFRDAFEDAFSKDDLPRLTELISQKAVLNLQGKSHHGPQEIYKALKDIQKDDAYLQIHHATALGASYRHQLTTEPNQQINGLTSLRRLDGNWQIVRISYPNI